MRAWLSPFSLLHYCSGMMGSVVLCSACSPVSSGWSWWALPVWASVTWSRHQLCVTWFIACVSSGRSRVWIMLSSVLCFRSRCVLFVCSAFLVSSLIVTLCLSLSFCGCILILLFHIWMPLKSIRPSPSLRTFHLPYFSSAELRWRIHKSTAGGSLLSDRRSSLKMCV